jgi:hypothetical protein
MMDTSRYQKRRYRIIHAMNWPTINITISANALAVYATVVSTITAVAQIWYYYLDRRNIKVVVRHNMQIYGDPRYAGVTLTTVRVGNAGRRPVTITSVGAIRDVPNTSFSFQDMTPQVPVELTEGKYLVAVVPLTPQQIDEIQWYYAGDALGNEYTTTDWLTRWIFARRLKEHAKQRR